MRLADCVGNELLKPTLQPANDCVWEWLGRLTTVRAFFFAAPNFTWDVYLLIDRIDFFAITLLFGIDHSTALLEDSAIAVKALRANSR